MERVARELGWRDIITELAELCSFDQEIADEVGQLLVSMRYMLAAVE